MDKRTYLVSKGLAKANARGRFSREGTAEIKQMQATGFVFDEVLKVATSVVVEVEQEVKLRDLGEELLGFTQGGWSIGFSNCRACGKNINVCPCVDGIVAPAIIESLPNDSPARIVRKR